MHACILNKPSAFAFSKAFQSRYLTLLLFLSTESGTRHTVKNMRVTTKNTEILALRTLQKEVLNLPAQNTQHHSHCDKILYVCF